MIFSVRKRKGGKGKVLTRSAILFLFYLHTAMPAYALLFPSLFSSTNLHGGRAGKQYNNITSFLALPLCAGNALVSTPFGLNYLIFL